MPNAYYLEYVARINRAINYIEINLDKELTLDAIADVANFSKFHFHRIFTAFIGETLFDFILRLRIEKAAGKLCFDSITSIGDIAFDVGFSNLSAFSRAFKRLNGISPTEYRTKKIADSNFSTLNSNNEQIFSKNGKRKDNPFDYFRSINILQNNLRIEKMFDEKEMNVTVKDLPETTVAYIRNIGPYAGNSELFQSLFAKLFAWAGPRGLLNLGAPDCNLLTISHDDPKITEESKLRLSLGITVPENTHVEGEISKMNIPAGKYACGRFEINMEEYPKAWDSMYGVWLPQSGYACGDGYCHEVYLNDPKQHPQGKHIVEIRIPIKTL